MLVWWILAVFHRAGFHTSIVMLWEKHLRRTRICTQTSKTSLSLNKVSWDSNSSDMSSRQDVSRHSHNTRTAVEFLENSAKWTMLNFDHWELKSLWTAVLWRNVCPFVSSWCSLFSSIYRICCQIKRLFVSDGGQISWWSSGMMFTRNVIDLGSIPCWGTKLFLVKLGAQSHFWAENAR